MLNELNELSRAVDVTDIPDFAKVSELQEFAPSMEIQAQEIRDIFYEIPELSYDRWKELSIDRRAELLGYFETKIAAIEMRDPLRIEHEATAKSVAGYFDGSKIVISDNQLGRNDIGAYWDVLDTLFHEGRHAYQYHNIYGTRTERSDELFRSWEVNMKEMGYQPGNSFTTAGLNRYFCQPVEVDARVFAELAVKTLRA